MRAILTLYMVAPVEKAVGLRREARSFGLWNPRCRSIYRPSGGACRSVPGRSLPLLGGIIIACGHFSMVYLSNFLLPRYGFNCRGYWISRTSAMVGSLYDKDDPRRDSVDLTWE
jgi:dipeptide/tripeptide permease